MFYLHLCEKRGSGMDRTVASLEEKHLPPTASGRRVELRGLHRFRYIHICRPSGYSSGSICCLR